MFIAWASHCDFGPYHGWVMSYDAKTLEQTGVYNATPDGEAGGIWQSGGGLAVDPQGGIYCVTGNGTFDLNTGGKDAGDSVLRLSSDGGLTLADSFTPFDQQHLSDLDIDLGSSGALILPDQTGPHPRLLVTAGKNGTIYLLDRDNLGGFNATDNSQIVQSIEGLIGASFCAPAYWNGRVYFHSAGDVLKYFTLTNGQLSALPVSSSTVFTNFPGSTPVVSSNGNADGIVWEIQVDLFKFFAPATLHAFDAIDLTHELYSSDAAGERDRPGPCVKFSAPVVANGRVFVGAFGKVSVYGLK